MSSPSPDVTGAITTTPVERCPACGERGALHHQAVGDRLHGVEGTWDVFRCRGCGSFFLDPRPDDASLGRCYPEEYFTHGHGESGPRTLSLQGWQGTVRRLTLAGGHGYAHLRPPTTATRVVGKALAAVGPVDRRATAGLGARLADYGHGGRLLDVGCGAGTYLHTMRALGWDVAGVEVDQAAAEVARTRHGLEVWPSLEDAPAGAFDVVTSNHVLEHVPDPVAFLGQVVERMKVGAHLVVVTPNAASLGSRMLGRDWYLLDPPRHLAVYTPAGIRAAVARVDGLEAVTVRTSAQMGAKVTHEWLNLRRRGGFKRASGSRRERVAARVAGGAETLVTHVRPYGEELVLTARRA